MQRWDWLTQPQTFLKYLSPFSFSHLTLISHIYNSTWYQSVPIKPQMSLKQSGDSYQISKEACQHHHRPRSGNHMVWFASLSVIIVSILQWFFNLLALYIYVILKIVCWFIKVFFGWILEVQSSPIHITERFLFAELNLF